MRKNINTYCFTPDEIDDLEHGDDVRVRPYIQTQKTYGQGKNTGPRLRLDDESVSFSWGQALTLSSADGLGDPEQGTITIACVALCPELFMSENNYQTYLTGQDNE